MEQYNLLAIDPGSEKSAFLWCRVTPPEEWALPFGVEPLVLSNPPNSDANHRWLATLADPMHGQWHLAIESLPGLFGGTSGTDQIKADQFAHRVAGWADTVGACAVVGGRSGHEIYRATARSMVTGDATANDGDVRRALIDIYGGKAKAIGGGRCKTCKKAKGWLGREHRDCPNCKGGHGATGFETPPGVFAGWTGSHGFAALAVAIVAAQRIGS